jgi:hypothetical protein
MKGAKTMTNHYVVYDRETGRGIKDFYGCEACWLACSYVDELNEKAGRDRYDWIEKN